MKQLTLVIVGPCRLNLKKLLDSTPCLQNLDLSFWHTSSAFIMIIHDLFEHLSSSPPLAEGDIPGFLPDLQSLTISIGGTSMLPCIPRLFSWPHRKRLHLKVNKVDGGIEMDNDTLRKILRLVDDGADIRILQRWDIRSPDYLQQFKETSPEGDLSQVLNVVDHALDGESVLGSELVTANDDKEGFSFSRCISYLFCRR